MASKWPVPDDLPDLDALGFVRVPPGSDPPDVHLAHAGIDDLPVGVWHGEMAPDELPKGPGDALGGSVNGWEIRLVHGAGYALREGKGPPRGDGTRPKLKILEPCTSITLRAVGFDPEWDDVTHHVVIGWCRVARTGKSGPELAWAWSSEPTLGLGSLRPFGRTFRRNPRLLGLAAASALLAGPPSDAAMSTAYAPGDAERMAYAMLRAAGERS